MMIPVHKNVAATIEVLKTHGDWAQKHNYVNRATILHTLWA